MLSYVLNVDSMASSVDNNLAHTCRHAAQVLDSNASSATMDAAMAKRFATDACFRVADSALQLHGGYGYLKDYPVERVLRDLRVHSILEGTNEVMRVIIAREMLKQQASK